MISFGLGPEFDFFALVSFVLLVVGLLAGFALGIDLTVGRVPVGRRVGSGVATVYLVSVTGLASWYSLFTGSAVVIPGTVGIGVGAVFVGFLVGAIAGASGLAIVALARGLTRAHAPSDFSPGSSVRGDRH